MLHCAIPNHIAEAAQEAYDQLLAVHSSLPGLEPLISIVNDALLDLLDANMGM
jgi:hypothetical protein